MFLTRMQTVGHLVSSGVVAALEDHVLREQEDARLPERRALVPQQLRAAQGVGIGSHTLTLTNSHAHKLTLTHTHTHTHTHTRSHTHRRAAAAARTARCVNLRRNRIWVVVYVHICVYTGHLIYVLTVPNR